MVEFSYFLLVILNLLLPFIPIKTIKNLFKGKQNNEHRTIIERYLRSFERS